jgi:hypothetical protein
MEKKVKWSSNLKYAVYHALFGTLLVKDGFARTLSGLGSRADEPCAQVSAIVAPMRVANPTSKCKIDIRLTFRQS